MKTLILVMLAGAAACQANPQPTPDESLSLPVGKYVFEETVAPRDGAPAMSLKGTVYILADTIFAEMNTGGCKYNVPTVPNHSQHYGFAYTCGDVALNFAAEDPLTRSSYSTSTVVSTLQSVCVRFTTGPQGQQVCVGREPQPVEHSVVRTGLLHLHPAGG